MIKLNIEEYCHNCPDFEVSVDKTHAYCAEYALDWFTTEITCKHRSRCKEIKSYLEKEIGNERTL